MRDYTDRNKQRLERYYEKAGKERGKNPQEFDKRVTRGYHYLDSLETFRPLNNPHAHERY